MPLRPGFSSALAAGAVVCLLAPAGASTHAAATTCALPSARVVEFARPQQFGAGRGPWFAIGADLNHDGRADLAVANSAGGPGVSLLMNRTEPGSARAAFSVPVGLPASGFSQQALASGDFNTDGKTDLAVGNFLSANGAPLLGPGIQFYVNHTRRYAASPDLDRAGTVEAGTGPEAFAVADFNQDGRPDLAFSDYGILDLGRTSDVSVVLNKTRSGSDRFVFSDRAIQRAGVAPIGVSAADVNGDGRPDLVVANNFSYSVSVLLNRTPAGARRVSFAAPVDFRAGSPVIGPETLTTGDLNRDGRPDIVTPNFLSDGLGSVSVLLNTTSPGTRTPRFASQATFRAGIGPQHAQVGDLNGDHVVDLAVANYGAVGTVGAGVSVFVNQTTCRASSPVLANPTSHPAGNGPTSLVARDFNRDGRLDLAVTNHFTLGPGGVSVLLNTTTRPKDYQP